jgi:hypothetical protein
MHPHHYQPLLLLQMLLQWVSWHPQRRLLCLLPQVQLLRLAGCCCRLQVPHAAVTARHKRKAKHECSQSVRHMAFGT